MEGKRKGCAHAQCRSYSSSVPPATARPVRGVVPSRSPTRKAMLCPASVCPSWRAGVLWEDRLVGGMGTRTVRYVGEHGYLLCMLALTGWLCLGSYGTLLGRERCLALPVIVLIRCGLDIC